MNINNSKTKIEKGDIKELENTNEDPKVTIKEMITNGEVLQIVDYFGQRTFTGDGMGGIIPIGTGQNYGLDKDYKRLLAEPGVQMTTLDTLLEKSRSFVGVFSTLYSSMINTNEMRFSKQANDANGFFKSFLQTTYNVLYLAVLLLPLAVLAIVLMARVAILRVIIAASPIIILLHVFKKDIKVDAITGDKSYFALKNIGNLLLAPVLISFALSLSTIFVTILNQSTNRFADKEPLPTNILGLFEVNIQGTGADLSKVLINVMGIGIVRFLLFRAIKQNKIGEAI